MEEMVIFAYLVGLLVMITLAGNANGPNRRTIQWIINALFFALMIPFVWYLEEIIEIIRRQL